MGRRVVCGRLGCAVIGCPPQELIGANPGVEPGQATSAAKSRASPAIVTPPDDHSLSMIGREQGGRGSASV